MPKRFITYQHTTTFFYIISINCNHILDNGHNYDYNIIMKQRWYYITHSSVALICGMFLYLLFRQGTYLHSFLCIPADNPLACISFTGDQFIRYYLPDFLWGYSLCCGILAIIMPQQHKHTIMIVLIVSALGCAWELLQYCNIVKGTGDMIDCMLYITAACLAGCINIFKGRDGK